jgi:hypothetical protein
MDKVIEYAPAAAIFLVAVGLIGYAFALLLAAFFSKKPGSLGARLAAWFTAAQAQNLGIPCSVSVRPVKPEGVWSRIQRTIGTNYPLADVFPRICCGNQAVAGLTRDNIVA